MPTLVKSSLISRRIKKINKGQSFSSIMISTNINLTPETITTGLSKSDTKVNSVSTKSDFCDNLDIQSSSSEKHTSISLLNSDKSISNSPQSQEMGEDYKKAMDSKCDKRTADTNNKFDVFRQSKENKNKSEFTIRSGDLKSDFDHISIC